MANWSDSNVKEALLYGDAHPRRNGQSGMKRTLKGLELINGKRSLRYADVTSTYAAPSWATF